MGKKQLMMLEVSQKQAFIYENKKLKSNIAASKLIQYVTSEAYFKEIASTEFRNGMVVYDGGGHTLLEFSSKEDAVCFAKRVTKETLKRYKGLELFVKILPYNEEHTPEENEKDITKALEEKKAIRRSSFSQRTFGIEAMHEEEKKEIPEVAADFGAQKDEIRERKRKIEEKYALASEFKNLGGSKDDTNFIAIVHIDGNLMGKRVANLKKQKNTKMAALMQEKSKEGWEAYKKIKRAFSESIDSDFKAAYYDMLDKVDEGICQGILTETLSLEEEKGKLYFPVRDIVLAGDDVCFVTEGRIGIACAVAYLKSIWEKVNAIDGKNYSACAGVAIVHQKYPFYRAYELAEALCSNAKKMIAELDEKAEANVCAIDWHVEYGELANGLAEIRQQYQNREGKQLEMRPYIVCGDAELCEKEKMRTFENFKRSEAIIQKGEAAARGKMKMLRNVLKEKEKTAVHFITRNGLNGKNGIVWNLREEYRKGQYDMAPDQLFYKTYDEKERNILFDAIEMMDIYTNLV